MPGPVQKVTLDPRALDLGVVRQVVLGKLRSDRAWNLLKGYRDSFREAVEFAPQLVDDEDRFDLALLDAMWQLVGEGVIAPGRTVGQPTFPWFHVTTHGRDVLAAVEYQPHDPTGYLAQLCRRVAIDKTALAYVTESLQTFTRGNLLASMMMLGIASERVFNLICDSLLDALADPGEAKTFAGIMGRMSMKAKLVWAHNKIRHLERAKPTFSDLPETPTLTLTLVYDLMRAQRNDLGHPREVPPQIDRQEAYARLQVFPKYYEDAESFRQFLAKHRGHV